jgi:hypothetical protein
MSVSLNGYPSVRSQSVLHACTEKHISDPKLKAKRSVQELPVLKPGDCVSVDVMVSSTPGLCTDGRVSHEKTIHGVRGLPDFSASHAVTVS